MKRPLFYIFSLLVLLNLMLNSCSDKSGNVPENFQNDMTWWYNSPAKKYWEGFPLGTGRFAAMVHGGVNEEIITFNDETLWQGSPYDPNPGQAEQAFEKTRELIRQKEYTKAMDEANGLLAVPSMKVQNYQPMAALHLTQTIEGHAIVEDSYYRGLNMDSALSTVRFRDKTTGITFKREFFASFPDQVVVVRLSADRANSIYTRIRFSSLHKSAEQFSDEDGSLVIRGGLETRDEEIPSKMNWFARISVLPDGGSLTTSDNNITVENATSVVIILAGATNHRGWNSIDKTGKLAETRTKDWMRSAAGKTYLELLDRHIADYTPRFRRCQINLGSNAPATQSTKVRLMNGRSKLDYFDPLYFEQYFQYARYLMLAGARESTYAFNNHNIWLNDLKGRWRGRWTLNININECYWPIEITNLPEINGSLLKLTRELSEAGKRTAASYGLRGWCSAHGTDIWMNTAIQDKSKFFFPLSGAWLLQQLYEHYVFNPSDLEYLQEIYPMMKEHALFAYDLLEPDEESGWLVSNPSSSPEQDFKDPASGETVSLSQGSAIFTQLTRNLFRNTIEAAKTLQCDENLQRSLGAALGKLPAYKIGQQGELLEFLYDFKTNLSHRHISHLFAAYPDDDITLKKSKKLSEAVMRSIQLRGQAENGWSEAHKACIWARMQQPEEAWAILRRILYVHPDLKKYPEDSDITPSYEGNQAIQGIAAAMMELLLQSHEDEIKLLPSLPEAWQNGWVKGLRARGGFEIEEMKWKDGELINVVIRSTGGRACKLVYHDTLLEFPTVINERYSLTISDFNK